MNFSEALVEKRAFMRVSKISMSFVNGDVYLMEWPSPRVLTDLDNRDGSDDSLESAHWIHFHCYRPSLPDSPIWWPQKFRERSLHIGKREDPGDEVGVSICLWSSRTPAWENFEKIRKITWKLSLRNNQKQGWLITPRILWELRQMHEVTDTMTSLL